MQFKEQPSGDQENQLNRISSNKGRHKNTGEAGQPATSFPVTLNDVIL
jgi:hypothetical protein